MAAYIQRSRYLSQLAALRDTGKIKILSGMRRVGKSTLLQQVRDEILRDVPTTHKIVFNLADPKLRTVRHFEQLSLLVNEATTSIELGGQEKLYLFFDELQLVDSWEQLVASLHQQGRYDIYITISHEGEFGEKNSNLPPDYYQCIEIYPFSFAEYLDLYGYTQSHKKKLHEAFSKYIKFGGMPELVFYNVDDQMSESNAKYYLSSLMSTVILQDILPHHQLRDVKTLELLLSFVSENTGRNFSALSIRKHLKAIQKTKTPSVDTILSYLQFLEEAFVIKKVPRFDVHGKRLLKVDEKYFLTDLGIRWSLGFSEQNDIEQILENVVVNELLYRGYTPYIGRVNNQEIDFVAIHPTTHNPIYLQVTYKMEQKSTREREFGVFNSISDNFPKYVLSLDERDFSQNGVIHLNLIDFLLHPELID